jgi:23S rRNA (cytidine2498-2'-O)-methyltransferase
MSSSSSAILFSAAEDYLPAAVAEMREAYPEATITPLGPTIAAIVEEGLAIADVAEAALAWPFIFVRHLMRQVGIVPERDRPSIATIVEQALATWETLPLQPAVALQVWSSGDSNRIRPDELRRAVADALGERGIVVARSGKEQVLSLVLLKDGVAIGLNGRGSALADWPGGQVRLAKPREQISRSEFKLEELFREYPIEPPRGGRAIDLGASPGGWTRILRTYDMQVWSVDPADLHPRLAADPAVHHVRSTAGPFLLRNETEVDLIVNDMRMTPDLSSQLMLDAARSLREGGMIVLTLKLTPHHPLEVIDRAIATLRRWYDIDLIRQLHHNRNEVTVVGHRLAAHRGKSA